MKSDTDWFRIEMPLRELQTVWNVEIVDLEFGKFVRTWNEEFKTVKWEELQDVHGVCDR